MSDVAALVRSEGYENLMKLLSAESHEVLNHIRWDDVIGDIIGKPVKDFVRGECQRVDCYRIAISEP